MSNTAKVWIWATIALVACQVAASILLPQSFALSAVTDCIQCVLLLSGTLAVLPMTRIAHGRVRMFWALMTLGVGFWLVYQLLWTYFEVVLRKEVPNPFVGDVVLYLHLVPMTGALALQPQVEQDQRTTRLGWLDLSLLVAWWAFLYVYTVMPWQYASFNEAAYNHNLNVVYLTEKMVFLGGLAIVWSRARGSWNTVFAHWFGASILYAFSSYFANWAIGKNVYYTGSLYDVPLTASMAWVTAAGLMAYTLSSKTQATKSEERSIWVARLGMLALVSLPVFAAITLLDPRLPSSVRVFRVVLTLVMVMVMGMLVFLKQRLLDRELIQLLRASEESLEGLKQLQVQLLHSEKLASLGQLAGGAAHELNNPLTAMLGYSELLVASPLEASELALAGMLGEQVRHTKMLVSNLTSVSRHPPASKTPIDLNGLAQTVVKLSQAQMCAHNVRIATRLAPGLPKVMGDSNQLMQVCIQMTNRVLQSIGGSGGSLAVQTRQSEAWVFLEILQEESVAAEPDFQPITPASENVGAGLASCYAVIEEHSGRILSATRPGCGYGFRIELPLTPVSRERASDSDSHLKAYAASTAIPS